VNRGFRRGTRPGPADQDNVNDFTRLLGGTASALSRSRLSMVKLAKEERRMTQARTMGYALLVFALLMVAAVATTHAAPPDEVQAPRTQEVNAP
jgi:hypothetical protein